MMGTVDTSDAVEYRYTRDGATFVIGTAGLTYTEADGTVKIDRKQEIPSDVIVSTILDLTLAGWTLVTE